MPPHFQLPTEATAVEREKVQFDFFVHIKKTRGQFGCDMVEDWPCRFGTNKKGGMNDMEFDKYIESIIMPLYPDMEDKPSKRVLLKVDSGPGCNNLDLLSKAHYGLYIFPGLSIVMPVQQETNHNYGLFKGTVQSNLDLISLLCFVMKEHISLLILTIGLIVYGGECLQTHTICQD